MPREEKIRVGFAGDHREITVTVADGDSSPWDLDDEHRLIGTNVPRADGADKVTGRARYAYDVNLPGLCHAKVLRSPHPAAVVTKIDLSAAAAMKGVVATISMEEGKPVLYAGQEVAAVAAVTEDIARDAISKIEVTYETKPFVTDVETARADGAPGVFPGTTSNVRAGPGAKRNAEKLEEALAKSEKVVEATYRTQVQTHSCLESHGCVARWEEDGGLTVWASTQATAAWHRTFDRQYRLRGNMRVITHHMGGGFGSKFGPRLFERWCVELARRAKRPVKLMRERKGEQLGTGNRPSSVQRFRGGATKDGKVTALEIDDYGTGGTAAAGARNIAFYDVPVFVKTEASVFTNAGPACAMRAPGWPQGVYALDSFMDELAAAIGMDPVEFRRKNDPDPVRNAQYDIAMKEIGWDRRRPDGSGKGPVVRGFGMANTQWFNAGSGSWRIDGTIRPDGTVEVRSGVQDIGTGTRTIIGMAVAEELGLTPGDISVRIGDTSFPDGPASGGSTTAPSVFPAARNTGTLLGQALIEKIAPILEVPAGKIEFRDGRIIDSEKGRNLSFAQACALLPEPGIEVAGQRFPNYEGYKNLVAGTQFAEVEVDTETGLVTVVKIVAVQDCGTVIDRLTAESQVIGAVIGGLSYALFEDRILDANHGHMVNPDLLFYKIAGPREMPEIVPVLFDVSNGKNNAGLMGLGEPPAIPTAGAIANAVANATGARVRELPITPDRVLAALEAKARGG
jgi:xanthine dehydrogenase YagR molybdenum-binding subunit